MTGTSLSLQFQLTFDEYAEALAASRSIKPTKGKAKRNTALGWAILFAIFICWIAIIAFQGINGSSLDDDAVRTRLAENIMIPIPWIMLLFLAMLLGARTFLGLRWAQAGYLLLTIFCVAIAMFIAKYQWQHTGFFTTYTILGIAFFSVGKMLFQPSGIQAIWKASPHLHETCDLIADYDSIRLQYPLMKTEFDWRMIKSWTETRNTILIWVGTRSFHIVPKRVFDAEKLKMFLDLLVDATKTRQEAFPVIPMATVAQSTKSNPPVNT
ncbi:MAG TPA: YcxB family protein [Tepidisphaeraceae bacterium]|jgi:hypothetical protein|nr:YcxB family protein [Tepidisphaeraceae bacterium]